MAEPVLHFAYDGRPVERWCPSCGFPLQGCRALSCGYCEAYPEVRGDYPPLPFLRAFPNDELNAAIEATWADPLAERKASDGG